MYLNKRLQNMMIGTKSAEDEESTFGNTRANKDLMG